MPRRVRSPGSAEARESGNYGEKAGASAGATVEGLGAFGKITGELGATALPGAPDHVRHLLQRVPGQLLAALDRPADGPARRHDLGAGHAHRLPVDRQGSCAACGGGRRRAPTSRPPSSSTCRSSRSSTVVGTGSTSRPATSRCSLHSAVWGFETERTQPGTVSIGIPTFNRPDFCVDQLLKLSEDAAVLEILDEILVVDQGTQRVVDHPDFDEAQSAPRHEAAADRAGQPRRLRRLLPGDERGRLEGHRRLRPGARRRRRLRARGHPARGRLRRPREGPDARRWPDVQPLRPVGHARVRRDRRQATAGSGDRPRTRCTATTSRSSRCARRSGCTAGSTSTTTAGGCA